MNNIKTETKKSRIVSIDILRGFAIILMALDHTRDYFGPTLFDVGDLSKTNISLFFTRWITHLGAPMPIIHLAAIGYDHVVLNSPGGWWFNADSPVVTVPWPALYHFNLSLVYLAWFMTLVVTYPLCAAYRNFKSKHTYKWLYYL